MKRKALAEVSRRVLAWLQVVLTDVLRQIESLLVREGLVSLADS